MSNTARPAPAALTLEAYGALTPPEAVESFQTAATYVRNLALETVKYSRKKNEGYHNEVAKDDVNALVLDFLKLDADNSTLTSAKFAALIRLLVNARSEDDTRIARGEPRPLGHLGVALNNMPDEIRATHPGLGFLVKTRAVFEDIVADAPVPGFVRQAMEVIRSYPDTQLAQLLQSLFLIYLSQAVLVVDAPKEDDFPFGSIEYVQDGLLLYTPSTDITEVAAFLGDNIGPAAMVITLAYFDAAVGTKGVDGIGRPAFASMSLEASPAAALVRQVFGYTVRDPKKAASLLPAVCGKMMLKNAAVWPWMTLVTGPYI